MKEKPKRTSGSFFAGHSGRMLFYTSFIVSLLVSSVVLLGKFALGLDDTSLVTMSFLTLCIAELFHSFDLKSDTESLFSKKIFKNTALNWAYILSLFLTIVVVILPIPFLQNALGICNISILNWLICFAFAILIIPFTEIYKVYLRRKDRAIKPKHNTKKQEIKINQDKVQVI